MKSLFSLIDAARKQQIFHALEKHLITVCA
jgi:hypothetical protein